MAKKASEDAMAELHNQLAQVLTAAIKSGEAPAAVLAVARGFLKDNGITATADKGSPLGNLVDALGVEDDDYDAIAAEFQGTR